MKLKNIRSDFTMVPNQWFKSKLSLKALGLLAMMQSLPEDWEFTVAGLQALAKDGKNSVQTALVELKEAGFVEYKQTKGEHGQFAHNEIRLKVRPKERKAVGDCAGDGKSVDGKSATIKYNINKENNNKEKNNKLSKDNLGETPKNEYGDSEINKLFDEWESAFGYKPRNTKPNRYAVSNLLRSKSIGRERLVGIIKALPKLQAQPYCIGEVKKVADFVTLQRNWDHVWNTALQKWKKQQEAQDLEDWRI